MAEEDQASLFDGMDFVLSVAPDQDLDGEDQPSVASAGPLDEDLFTGMSMLSTSTAPSISGSAATDSSPPGNGDAKISIGSPRMERKSFDSIMAAYDSVGSSKAGGGSGNGSGGLGGGAAIAISSSSKVGVGSGRKKKKSLRIGYGRDNDDGEAISVASSDQVESSSSMHAFDGVEIDRVSSVSSVEFSSQREAELEIVEETDLRVVSEDQAEIQEPAEVSQPKPELEDLPGRVGGGMESEIDVEAAKVAEEVLAGESVATKVAEEVLAEENPDATGSSTMTMILQSKLESIKQDIAKRLRELDSKAAEASIARKTASQIRRKAAEELSAAASKRKELEIELENACEREDFDLADKLSQEVADAEKNLEMADLAFKDADSKYDLAAVEMESIVAMKVGIEEQGAASLASLQEEAQAAAEDVKLQAEEIARVEMEKLTSKEEDLDMKNTQCLLELRSFEESKEELEKTIAEAIAFDVREKIDHLAGRQLLVDELQELLRKVKDKESEIAKRDSMIEAIDAKIARVTATFEENQLSIDANLNRVAGSFEELEMDSTGLQISRKEVEESLNLAAAEAESLKNTAAAAAAEALSLRDELERWRKAAEFSKEIKEKKLLLVRKEEEFLAEAQSLRQQASEARSSLQELSSTKMRLQEEIRAAKQKLAHHEKRGPALEAEKRLAAATRKFKEAARLSAEAKAFRAEQEAVTEELQRCSGELQQIEERIETKIVSLSDVEGSIAVKEREAAQACCERLRLVAVAARNERSVAVELDDLDEAESLQIEAAAADAEADELQRIHQFQGSEFGNVEGIEETDAVAADK